MNGIQEVQTCEDAQSVNHIIGIEKKGIKTTKVCNKCGLEKELSEFYPRLHAVRSDCKQCAKAYRERPDVKKRAKILYKAQHKAKYKARKSYYKAYYKADKSKILARGKAYRKANKKKRNAYARKRRADPKIRLNCNMSTAVRFSLKNGKENSSWLELVDFTLKQLIKHIEKQFVDGMSWENQGSAWHIDHKIPISVFNFTNPEHRDFKRCWALKNLQPMWASDNMSKQAKLNKPFQPSLLF